jgi:hypothetical protein
MHHHSTSNRHRTNPRTNPPRIDYGPHADDVPVCPVCDRYPDRQSGVTFLRDGYAFGDACDACATTTDAAVAR